jgi:hypothetical protein
MKDIFCVAVFLGKMLCLLVFVSAMRPDRIDTVHASIRPAHCKPAHAGTQGCGPSVLARTSDTDVTLCSASWSALHC